MMRALAWWQTTQSIWSMVRPAFAITRFRLLGITPTAKRNTALPFILMTDGSGRAQPWISISRLPREPRSTQRSAVSSRS